MTRHDHLDGDAATPAPGGPALRGKARIATGVAGLAVVLGIGAYVITDKATQHEDSLAGVAPPVRVTSAASLSSTPSSSEAPAAPSPSTKSAARTPSPPPAKVVASIKAAREDMAEHGVKVKRPPVAKATLAPAVGLSRTTVGTLDKGGIVRVVSARSDLTGQQELAWVAGGTTDYGDAECSQTFKLYNSPKPEKKSNLLLCWRTSARKSVIAIVVDPKGNPSMSKALAKLHEKWESMG